MIVAERKKDGWGLVMKAEIKDSFHYVVNQAH